jgi:hypothetical protein
MLEIEEEIEGLPNDVGRGARLGLEEALHLRREHRLLLLLPIEPLSL